MFKIESYVTPILLSYVDKYVRDFKPADAQVSLWGGGVCLHNLVLKADVLQQEVSLPFTLVSGRIHELLIQVPWTKIMSEPIIVTIDTIECVLGLNPQCNDESPPPESPSRKTQVVEAPPGYMQALVRRIVSNIALRVHHLIVKYVQDDIVLSLNVKHLAVDSAGPNWEAAFADIDQVQPVIRRLVRLDDLTLCLDRADSDGKIRLYQEPLLYRCQLDFRILTRLVSATTRRATNLSIQLRSSKLAWGVTNDQLTLLLRLVRERSNLIVKPPSPAPKNSTTNVVQPMHVTSSNSAEPARLESWSEWAWSWLPTWSDKEGVEEPALPPACVPVDFAGYFDDVTVVFKTMDVECNNRKRARGILELQATHSAFKSYFCKSTAMRLKFGTRIVTVLSKGKCVCGHLDYNAANEEPTVYLSKESTGADEEWQWPEDQKQLVETAQAIDEQYRATPELQEVPPAPTPSHPEPLENQPPHETKDQTKHEGTDDLWKNMKPQIYLEFIHDRSPPDVYTNPYDCPPEDFQYSDWVEECEMKICFEASVLNVCMGLIHRLMVLKNIINDLPPVPEPDVPMRTLTVEECESLAENMPQRRVTIETKGLKVKVIPWEHGMEKPDKPVLLLELDMPKNNVIINGPLYPHRVCSAACQMPADTGALYNGARLHVTVNVNSVQARICSEEGSQSRPCGRIDVIAVVHILLNKGYFVSRECVHLGYSIKIREANICGSSARLQAAWQIPSSLLSQELSTKLKYTTLVEDALKDEESVAIDLTIEDLVVRGFYTNHIITHIVTLQSAKATALHDTPEQEHPKQAWLFSFPDAPTSSPYLRLAVQWCSKPIPNSLDYAGIWTEPAAIAVDPLFIAWMAYKPLLKPAESQSSLTLLKGNSSSHYFLRRRSTPPSSSGRGLSKSGSATELVHNRTRSIESSEKIKPAPAQHKLPLYLSWTNDDLLKMHERLRRMLVNMEIGLTLVYITMSTASALDCETVRDAMERHATMTSRVLALNFGRLTMYSSTLKRNFWNDIVHDGPTFVTPLQENQEPADQFPWRMRLADVSCYILEVKAGVDLTGKDKSATGLRSQLKTSCVATPRTVLELVTTTVTLSVVTKTAPLRPPHASKENRKTAEATVEDRTKYFTKGGTFKPSTLKEFVRGPANRKKDRSSDAQEKPQEQPKEPQADTSGPVISFGFNLHADTPPLIIRLDHDQVHVVAAAVHCFTHILALLKRPPLIIPNKLRRQSVYIGPSKTYIRSVSEIDETRSSEESRSENRSDLISIYEAQSVKNAPLFNIKTFFWFQWVVSRITLVAATSQVKLALDIDDIISTVDLQSHYNQFKVKVASLSLRHYERTESDEWLAGVLGGRVIEVREPSDSKEDNHFLTITMTQAQISNLPASWREELNPKLLEQKSSYDTMWEVYATLAPLEAIVEPKILENIVSLVVELAPRSFCPLQKEKDITQASDWQWPFLYITAGGLRLLLTVEDKNDKVDDTFMFVIGKVFINPYPENPICRRAINTGTEGGWLTSGGGIEGRQYELMIKNVGIRSAKFRQIVNQENNESEMSRGTSGENPAVMWTSPVAPPSITPVLHSVDIGCVVAPALYMNDTLTCGPAVELNIVSDCAIELSLDQLVLAQKLVVGLFDCIQSCVDQSLQFDEETQGACPYASLLMSNDPDEVVYGNITLITEAKSYVGESLGRNYDSGVDTVTNSTAVRKSLSVVFVEDLPDATDYLEIFVTMGMIEVSLYAIDDGSSEIEALKPPAKWERRCKDDDLKPVVKEESSKRLSSEGTDSAGAGSKSVTETARNEDMSQKHAIEANSVLPIARKGEGNVPLAHISLHQPNLYYWGRKTQRNIQISLFDAWIGLGAGGTLADSWTAVLLSTAKGQPDPVTDIPPALATLKVVVPCNAKTGATSINMQRGSIRLDIERPVMFEVSYDRLRRIKNVIDILNRRALDSSLFTPRAPTPTTGVSPFYKLKKLLVHQNMEVVTIQTTQIGLTGSQGACGWDALAIQVGAAARPDRLNARVLISAAVISSGPNTDARHVVLQPLMLGVEIDATWEAWRRAEGGLSAKEPMIKVSLEFDCMTLDLKPEDLKAVEYIREAFRKLTEESLLMPDESSSSSTKTKEEKPPIFCERPSTVTFDNVDDHFYKDDLRSGAFKIMSLGQLPMAYQVTLHNNAVSWKYPHPRAITRLVAYPLPGEDEETPCVLELYNQILGRWEVHTYFSIPVGEPRELQLYAPSPECAFAVMWRFRVFEGEVRPAPYEFNINKFQPRADPMSQDPVPEVILPKPKCGVTTEQLSGVVRVDSCFSPRLFPRVRVVTRMTQLAVYLHNEMPCTSSQATALEGYYVSKPLMRSHRVLSLSATDTTVHLHMASPAGKLVLVQANVSSDIIDCATGTMEQLVEEFRLQAAACMPTSSWWRSRVAVSRVHVALHVPRIRTLHTLGNEFRDAFEQHILQDNSKSAAELRQKREKESKLCEITPESLEGRVSLWIHNSCAVALRVGQEGTDEVVPLGPGVKLAYRWRSPTSSKQLHFARAGPSTDWHWSASIPFTAGTYKVRIQERESITGKQYVGAGVFLYATVEETGARRTLILAGRLCLANMLRFNLLYKVRALCSESSQWSTVCSGEMAAETVGRTVIAGVDCEMALKIKFIGESGWSGDIPLKECPKENVPWLVKLPSEGDMEFVSVWCRVVRARTDGRVLATVWPLYVLYSHLPLDTDVLIFTDSGQAESPPPLIQAAPGRGSSTHLLAPGTTAARHNLSFQYRHIDCPVTKEAVPLHYGVTDTSVFDKRSPVNVIDTVIEETLHWIERAGREAKSKWPYSLVTKHWPKAWSPALLQPRCDVSIRYRAVRVGGGCSMEMQLCPVVLLCNAAPTALTLRAHDAAPLCKLEPGTVISPPSAVLSKPFFISVETGRETFVSGELSISRAELGRYGNPQPGRVALDRPTELAILCTHKVALLTLYYEIKEDINVLGMSSTYMLINRLDSAITVSAMAVPGEVTEDISLRPTTMKVVEPTPAGSVYGTPLCRFWVAGRWRGSDPAELRLYLCVALSRDPGSPVRIGRAPFRRPISVLDDMNNSVPIVVTQIKHEGRWVITVAKDPCPQLLIHNKTDMAFAIAEPTCANDEPSTSRINVNQDCEGTRWYCVVQPHSMMHYSTPSHCLRYPPPSDSIPQPPVVFLTLAKPKAEIDPEWCPPVAITDGEQLVQLANEMTVKLKVKSHPHSTHIELKDVDHTDIAASDIRRRLIGAFSSQEIIESIDPTQFSAALERTLADDNILEHEEVVISAQITPEPSPTPEVQHNLNEDTDNVHTVLQIAQEMKRLKMDIQTSDQKSCDPSSVDLYISPQIAFEDDVSKRVLPQSDDESERSTSILHVNVPEKEYWDDTNGWSLNERLRVVASAISVEFSSLSDTRPLLALHLERTAVVVKSDNKKTKTLISVSDVQIDNLQYESGQFDFAVVASTRGEPLPEADWPSLWNIFLERKIFSARQADARALVKLTHESWEMATYKYNELSEVECQLGPLALYIEDAYVRALANLARSASKTGDRDVTAEALINEEQALSAPLRLKMLYIHPLHLTLTLHTAVRMYIALDQSPLRLGAFKLHDAMTSCERLTHALTVHYLSAAILGAGWVVGGLELLGAPGAVAARVGGATGGVRGLATAAAAALLHSLSAWAGSLARNLDLLAGDEEHSQRAAAARRRPPMSLIAGLTAGVTNFAINILGAVGGLAHHPLVGVAVGESESSATALRRGLIGALAKPLSATADLVAYAGHGLLYQTGWELMPQARSTWSTGSQLDGGWRRDCVRWSFRLAELTALAGFHTLLDGAALQLLFTHKYLVVADPDSERIVEMIDFKSCSVGPYRGQIIELVIKNQRRQSRLEAKTAEDEDDEIQISAAAMARVARYTGAETPSGGESRVLSLLPAPRQALALYAALAAATHHNSEAHFPLL